MKSENKPRDEQKQSWYCNGTQNFSSVKRTNTKLPNQLNI